MIFPMLFLFALTELMPWWKNTSSGEPDNMNKHALRLAGSLAIITGIALVVLWSTYDFRFQSRPAGLHMDPPLSEFWPFSQLTPFFKARVIRTNCKVAVVARILPVSGLADIARLAEATPAFLLGKVYPQGQWFYFPVVLAIKSTLGFLLLCLLVPAAKALRRKEIRREVLFLTIPPALYLVVAMSFGDQHGRAAHSSYLPIPCGSPRPLQRGNWRNGIGRGPCWSTTLLLFHVVSSGSNVSQLSCLLKRTVGRPARIPTRCWPTGMRDWGQGLKAMKRYMDQHQNYRLFVRLFCFYYR